MRLSQLFTKTLRENPKDEESVNAKLLTRGGFISKVMAGVFEYMPLGLSVLNKINNIIREEINAIGGQEIFMSVFQNHGVWAMTDRWNEASGVMYQFKDNTGKDYGLAFTHEEPITVDASRYITSYKDLPKAVYQICNKFRNEPRAKSGLLRGREFMMKDLYSFHATQEDLDDYYEKVATVYMRILERVDVSAVRTFASGGMFSKYSDEFQVLAEVGEDTIYINEKENRAVNKEVYNDEVLSDLNWNKENLVEKRAIEVGNIFKLGTRFSEKLGLNYTDENGDKKPVIMASYGIGPARLMGTIVELHNDKNGIIWPESVAPFKVHLIVLDGKNKEGDKIYDDLKKSGVEVLYDDREDKSAGEKFADADLIGCPLRIVVSEKTLEKDSVEMKKRNEKDAKLAKISQLLDLLNR
ncbi:MAG: prolyl-tRNA synthetase [Parcubacteria group bacterium Gr01-1014_2]|nr:MAG: prolyl-tRNA synthetase [Parcubacteria group bacterium Gr01-1014_2]